MASQPFQVSCSTDVVFELLSHRYRRQAIRVLDEHDCDLTLADLADETACREFESDIDEISAEDVRTVYLSLYHSHVPKLADAGVVEYNQERDVVSPNEPVSELRSVLSFVG